jgi:hypothetical protein
VARDLSHDEAHQEDNLLIEAVSLLVQRQRETEAWVAEQIEQADERAASVERHYAALESRLAGIEEQLDSLVREVEPGRGDAVVGQRLARLREQVADLRTQSDERSLRSLPPAAAAVSVASTSPVAPVAPVTPVTPVEPQRREPEANHVPPSVSEVPPPVQAPPAVTASTAGAGIGTRASLWELTGPTSRDRFGLALIGLGVVAVLYAVLTQLRFG